MNLNDNLERWISFIRYSCWLFASPVGLVNHVEKFYALNNKTDKKIILNLWFRYILWFSLAFFHSSLLYPYSLLQMWNKTKPFLFICLKDFTHCFINPQLVNVGCVLCWFWAIFFLLYLSIIIWEYTLSIYSLKI